MPHSVARVNLLNGALGAPAPAPAPAAAVAFSAAVSSVAFAMNISFPERIGPAGRFKTQAMSVSPTP